MDAALEFEELTYCEVEVSVRTDGRVTLRVFDPSADERRALKFPSVAAALAWFTEEVP